MRLTLETLVAGISARFINLSPADVDREINGTLASVCVLLDRQRALEQRASACSRRQPGA